MTKVEKYLFDKAVSAVIVSTTAALPFLGLPVISYLYEKVIRLLAKKFHKELSLVGFNIKVDIEVNNQTDSYKEAARKLEEVLENEDATEEEIQNASNDFDDALGDLISF